MLRWMANEIPPGPKVDMNARLNAWLETKAKSNHRAAKPASPFARRLLSPLSSRQNPSGSMSATTNNSFFTPKGWRLLGPPGRVKVTSSEESPQLNSSKAGEHADSEMARCQIHVMGNILCSELQIHRRYDLKGSSQGRTTDKLEIDETTTLKDLDLDFVFRLDPFWYQTLLQQIECDCKFLESQRIMDYSLLLGLHFQAPRNAKTILPWHSSESHVPENAIDRPASFNGSVEDKWNSTKRSDLVALTPDQNGDLLLSHGLGDLLKPIQISKVEVAMPGIPSKLGVQQLGINMPAKAEQRLASSESDSQLEGELFGEVYDVVLHFGIIDILQDYDITKRLEHAYKSLQFDSLSISAVDPKLYAKRFQDFICRIFIEES